MQLQQAQTVDSLHSLQLVSVLNTPVYQIRYYSRADDQPVVKTQLVSAVTGSLRPPLSESEATRIARNVFSLPASVEQTTYLTAAGSHREYRGKPLPAWAITFEHPSRATVYVAAELSTFQNQGHDLLALRDGYSPRNEKTKGQGSEHSIRLCHLDSLHTKIDSKLPFLFL